MQIQFALCKMLACPTLPGLLRTQLATNNHSLKFRKLKLSSIHRVGLNPTMHNADSIRIMQIAASSTHEPGLLRNEFNNAQCRFNSHYAKCGISNTMSQVCSEINPTMHNADSIRIMQIAASPT